MNPTSEKVANPVRGLFARTISRGEAVFALAGIAAVAIVAGVTGAGAWWSAHVTQNLRTREGADRAAAVASLLGRGVEHALARGDAGTARLLITEAALAHGFQSCRVVTPDGIVLADADPRRISASTIPDQWTMPLPDAPTQPMFHSLRGQVVGTVPLTITGRGAATLELVAPLPSDDHAAWEASAGIAALGVAGLSAMLVTYRLTRRRLHVVGLIRDTLLHTDPAKLPESDLTFADDLGPEARAWNALVRERETLRIQAAQRRADLAIAAGPRRDADFAAVCDALWQGVLVVDASMKVRYANGAAAVLLRAARESIQDADAESIIHEPEVLAALRNVASGSGRQRVTVESRRGEDPRAASSAGVLRFGVRPVRRDDSALALVLIEDVTQQRVADEARNAFVAQATHELRTPLTNIRLYIEQLIDADENAVSPAERASALNVINGEARRLERIVADMLSVSEIEAGAIKLRKGDVRTDALFRELEHDYRKQADEKHIDLAFDLPPKLPVLQGDRDKLALALHNLIGNGLKYTPEGGKVAVRVGVGPRSLTVDVEDNGIGIKPEEHELVFDKFYRAKDRRVAAITGSGLGLALAREVARLHGGDIILKSEPDKGSTFTLTLPVAA